ncbi:hypothetical protein QP555_00310 [Peptoniphilus lacrimalis]|uniref:hypothetical protein n=1 Tax=Peptoniphilus lacrimalis TaxID=33031 RepID=UPI00254D9B17|nr:hypothetical protein [Peptoniphilus lacrimalis]MDK7721457.1 hypothetical protein [Peptoniphilus lacrimalis]MDK7731058.1 hypothetical protein [Peptoniphilus lacrimalis]
MKNNFFKNLHIYSFLCGLVILFVSFFIPIDNFPTLKPIGMSTMIICPMFGFLGIIFSILNKKYIYIFLNLLLVFSFFIVMSLGLIFLGP